MDYERIFDPEEKLFCSVGLLAGSGGPGRVSKGKQTSESGTDIYRGLGQADEFFRTFGGAPTIANFAPGGQVGLPERRWAQVGEPQTVTQQPRYPQWYGPSGAGAAAQQGRFGLQSQASQQAPGYGTNMQIQAPQTGGYNPMGSQYPGPQYASAFNQGMRGGGAAPVPAQGGGAGRQWNVPTTNTGLTVQYPEKNVRNDLREIYGKHAQFPDLPGIQYQYDPEYLNMILQEQQVQNLSAQGIPTAQRTQDYGDTFRLPTAQTVFTPDVYQTMQNLGFTGNNQQVQAPGQYGDIALSGTASARAAQIPTTPQEFERNRQAIYEAQFRPQQQELERQREIAQREQRGQLANAGLATSAAGLARTEEMNRDFNQRLYETSRQAANQAAVQAFGYQQEQRLQNAANVQQANLANAGFSQQAQLTNAANLLTRQGQVDQNYLAAMGLNIDQANQVRDDFLSALGLEAADLERLDANQRQNAMDIFNNYLNLFTTVANIGRFSTGEAVSTGPGALISY